MLLIERYSFDLDKDIASSGGGSDSENLCIDEVEDVKWVALSGLHPLLLVQGNLHNIRQVKLYW
jgi:hypothetical protein